MASTLGTTEATPLAPVAPGITKKERGHKGPYPYWFYIPAAIIYLIFFMTPTILSFYFSFSFTFSFTFAFVSGDQDPADLQRLRESFILRYGDDQQPPKAGT